MSIDLPLDQMTVAEKLEAMESIWASLCSKPGDFLPPSWHEAILEKRKQRLAFGEATVSDWDDTWRRLVQLGK